MTINKNKINDNALKFIQKGQIKKAIKEYEKILAEDSADVRTLLKKGDLQVRVGERDQAIDTYLAVAGAYSQQGFHLKAVAVFKQILKIDEGRTDVNLRLAEEYQNLGIIGDAMSHLQIVAGYYDQQGLVRESLGILRRIVDLDPDNIASRIKLAELYSREEMITEAVEEFRRASQELKNANRVEDYIKVTERLIYHDPSDIQLIKELANIYLQRGDTKRALGKLQICFKSDPRDLETLSMLAMAFQELGQLSKTVSVHKEMAKIYQEQGSLAETQEVYRRILEIAPDDPEANQVLGGAQRPSAPAYSERIEASVPQVTMPTAPHYEIDGGTTEAGFEPEVEEQLTVEAPRPRKPAAPPQTVPAVRPAAATVSEQTREYISRLLTETDVYIKYGLQNKAYEHLNKVFEHDPNNIEAHDKLKGLYLTAGQSNHAAHEMVTLVHISARIGDAQRARKYLQELAGYAPAHPDLPGLKSLVEQQVPLGPYQPAPGEDFATIEPGGPVVQVADGDGLVEVDSLLDPIDVTLDFDDSAEISVDTGDLLDDSGDEQFTAPAVTRPRSAGGEIQLDLEPDSDVILLDGGGDLADEALLEETREADLADLAGIEDLQDLDDLVRGTGPGPAIDFPEEEDDDEASTRIAELDVAHFESIDDDAEVVLEAAQSLADDYGLGEDTMEVGQLATGVYPPGGLDQVDASGAILLDDGVPDLEPLPAADLLDDDSAIDLVSPDPGVSSDDQDLISFDGAEDPFFTEASAREPAAAPAADQESMFDEGEAATILHMEGPGGRLAGDLKAGPSAKAAGELDAELDRDEEADDSDLEDGLEEVEFFIQQNLLDEARDALAGLSQTHAEHPDVVAMAGKLDRLLKGEAPVAQVAPEDLGGPFNLAEEIEREVGDEFSAPDVDEFQYSVDDVFSEFKKGVEKVVEKEDSATHFDLGIAYKEMGLIDDAVSEFTVASQDKGRRVESLGMIGLCLVEKGQYSEAINRFKDALHSPGINDYEATGLYYEMGNVYELLNDQNESVFYFKKVFKRDPKFRDVTARLKALVKASGGKKPSNGDDAQPSSPSASSKNKISYM